MVQVHQLLNNETLINSYGFLGKYAQTRLDEFNSMSIGKKSAFQTMLMEYCVSTKPAIDTFVAQTLISSQQEKQTLSSKELERVLGDVRSHAADNPAWHLLRHKNSMLTGDIEISSGSLLKYSDFGLQSSNVHLQSVASQLAQMNFNLGYPKAAEFAIRQAIPFARDAKDESCLLNLLYFLCELPPDSSGTRPGQAAMLESLAIRSQKNKQWGLLVKCSILKARLGLRSGNTEAHVSECIENAQNLVIQHKLSSLEWTVFQARISCMEHYGQIKMVRFALGDILARLDDNCSDEVGATLIAKLALVVIFDLF